MQDFCVNQQSRWKRNLGSHQYHSVWFLLFVFKKRSESELWESEGHDSDSGLHVEPSFPRVLWPLPNSDEVKRQVDFTMFDSIQFMSNQTWQTVDCRSLSSVALAS